MANAKSFLFPFKYSSRVAFVAEFSHLKIRLYAQGALVRDYGTADGDDDEDDDYFGEVVVPETTGGADLNSSADGAGGENGAEDENQNHCQ